MNKSAKFSACRTYRYALRRAWDEGKPAVMFVCLNPSTADERADDPTSRRCVAFAKSWGFGALWLLNLFAYRTTRPQALRQVQDPVGPRNDWWLSTARREADLTVVAWGMHGALRNRGEEVLQLLGPTHCLGLTRGGHPRHPLYLRGDARPISFT